MLSRRTLRWALLLSLLLHVAVLLLGRGLGWIGPEEASGADAPPIAARLLPPRPLPSPPAPARKSALPKSSPTPPLIPALASSSAALSASPSAPSPAFAERGPPAAPAPVAEGGSVVARELPSSGRMRFAVTKGEGGFVVGRAVHDWKVEGNRYELNSVMRTTGLTAWIANIQLGQFSRGYVDDEGLHPETFRDNRKDGEYRSEFDWAQGQLRMGNGVTLPLQPGAQDILSMFYQFALFALDEPQISLMVTTGRKFERYVFSVRADVPLQLRPDTGTEDGTQDAAIPTYHLSYRGREAEGVDVWLARDMDRLPVKIRYTDRKGGVTELIAEEIDYQGKR